MGHGFIDKRNKQNCGGGFFKGITAENYNKNGHFLVFPDDGVCEATLWSKWLHRGDLTSATATIFLSVAVSGIASLIHRYPAVRICCADLGVKSTQSVSS